MNDPIGDRQLFQAVDIERPPVRTHSQIPLRSQTEGEWSKIVAQQQHELNRCKEQNVRLNKELRRFQQLCPRLPPTDEGYCGDSSTAISSLRVYPTVSLCMQVMTPLCRRGL